MARTASLAPAERRAATQAESLRAQPGAQDAFLRCTADVCVYGGQAGGGKTFGVLLDPCYHVPDPNFQAVCFRRQTTQITNPGGLWDDSQRIYPRLGGVAVTSPRHKWTFPSGATIEMAHLQHEKDKFSWDGAQIPAIYFDQLESFTFTQFQYLLGRNRSAHGIRPYMRGTCNPRADHWLRHFMDWWIDDRDDEDIPLDYRAEWEGKGYLVGKGYPRWDRSGIIRFFCIVNDVVYWADTEEELHEQHGSEEEGILPLSFTFIPARLEDNPALIAKDPGYKAKLAALSRVDRLRLQGGNWDVRETAGMFFQREWLEIVEAAPSGGGGVRYWDRAGTGRRRNKITGTEEDVKRASWTAGVKMLRVREGLGFTYYILDVCRFQGTSGVVMATIRNIATQDGVECWVGIEQDPAMAGKAEALSQVSNLAGFKVWLNPVRESKGVRAKGLSAQADPMGEELDPLATQAKYGNVKLVRGKWNEAFIQEAEKFDGTDATASDQIDGSSGAFLFFNRKTKKVGTWGR